MGKLLGLVAALVVIAVAVAMVVLTSGNGGDAGPAPAEPPQRSTLPGVPALHAARLFAAEALNRPVSDTPLTSLSAAGWDGCYGVHRAGGVCTLQFTAGLVAIFAGEPEKARFHVVGDLVIGPVVPGPGISIDSGGPVPPEIAPDLTRLLAEYARADLALRQRLDAATIVTASIVPATFDSCLGFQYAARTIACREVALRGAIVTFESGARSYRYHVSTEGIVAVSLEQGVATVEPDAAVVALHGRLRDDLARRANAGLGDISIVSFQEVTWPSGCLGVTKPGDVCTQALVEGWLAILTAGGREYRYHGAGERFIAASFEPGARLAEPVRR
ncbi:MAG: hypothetical protein ACKVVT_00265 [Dehalococcoidia bacterium]